MVTMQGLISSAFRPHATAARAGLAAGLGIGMLAWSGSAKAQTYYIDESTDYGNHPPCAEGNANLNTITQSLQASMAAVGWTGSRFTNVSAWPSDFAEECSTSYGGGDGEDGIYADTKRLAVWAGHSLPGLVSWGFPHNNVCVDNFEPNIRLGQMSGANTSVAMWLGCQVLTPDTLPTQGNYEWVREQLSWVNSIGIDDDEPGEFFDDTYGSTDRDAWLNDMSGSDREPIVVTYDSASISNCWLTHYGTSLAEQLDTAPRGGGPACGAGLAYYWYCFEYED
jgi:hypothetical protein